MFFGERVRLLVDTWTFENVELHSCVSAVASFQGRPGNVNEGISSAGFTHIFRIFAQTRKHQA